MSEQVAGVVPSWDVADRMRKALRVSGVGVQEMADYLDVSRGTVSNWVNGRIQPSVQSQRLWALRCGVPFEWLAEGVEPSSPDGGPSTEVRTLDYKAADCSRDRRMRGQRHLSVADLPLTA